MKQVHDKLPMSRNDCSRLKYRAIRELECVKKDRGVVTVLLIRGASKDRNFNAHERVLEKLGERASEGDV